MPIDTSVSVQDFLEAAAAKQPFPGGGACAALVGALGAAMGTMTLRYTKDDSVAEPIAELDRARAMFEQLVLEDQTAYQSLTETKKSGGGAGEVEAAAALAVAAPQAIATTALAVLRLAESVVPVANKWLLSDLAVCCELSMATLRCGIYNVRINLPDASDDTVKRASADCAKLLDEAAAVIQRVVPAIHARMNEA
ncbi:MAG: cyclodeaminase/cyclohydrolase family protein [Planctomycetota bacterium]